MYVYTHIHIIYTPNYKTGHIEIICHRKIIKSLPNPTWTPPNLYLMWNMGKMCLIWRELGHLNLRTPRTCENLKALRTGQAVRRMGAGVEWGSAAHACTPHWIWRCGKHMPCLNRELITPAHCCLLGKGHCLLAQCPTKVRNPDSSTKSLIST